MPNSPSTLTGALHTAAVRSMGTRLTANPATLTYVSQRHCGVAICMAAGSSFATLFAMARSVLALNKAGISRAAVRVTDRVIRIGYGGFSVVLCESGAGRVPPVLNSTYR